MSHELFWLVMTTAMTGLMWLPYILDRIMVRGLMATMANPSPNDKPQSPWAQRLMAAHVNAVENLVIFAPLVLATQDLNVNLATPRQRSPASFIFGRGSRTLWCTRSACRCCARWRFSAVSWRRSCWCWRCSSSLEGLYGNSATCSRPVVSEKPSITFMFCTA